MNNHVENQVPSPIYFDQFYHFAVKWTPRMIFLGLAGYYSLGLAYHYGLMAKIDQIAIPILKHYVGYAGLGAVMPTFQWYSAWAVRMTAVIAASVIYDLIIRVAHVVIQAYYNPFQENEKGELEMNDHLNPQNLNPTAFQKFCHLLLTWTPKIIVVGFIGYYSLGLAYKYGVMAKIDQIGIKILHHYVGYAGLGAVIPIFQWYAAWAVRITAVILASVLYDLIKHLLVTAFQALYDNKQEERVIHPVPLRRQPFPQVYKINRDPSLNPVPNNRDIHLYPETNHEDRPVLIAV